jgi:chromosome segregation ATPase
MSKHIFITTEQKQNYEKEIKLLKLKDEESTQLIIKLDTKLYNARQEINDLKQEMEKYDIENNNKIKELNLCLDSIKELSDKIQQENTQLKIEIEKLKNPNS